MAMYDGNGILSSKRSMGGGSGIGELWLEEDNKKKKKKRKRSQFAIDNEGDEEDGQPSNKKNLQAMSGLNVMGGGGLESQKSGTASSIIFTPVQGMELVDPTSNQDKVDEANKKWFNDSSGFASAKPK